MGIENGGKGRNVKIRSNVVPTKPQEYCFMCALHFPFIWHQFWNVAQQTISPVLTNGTDCSLRCLNVTARFIKRLKVIECLMELQAKYHLLMDSNQ